MDTLAFGYLLPATGRIRVFRPLETCAAGRTNLTGGAAPAAPPVLYLNIYLCHARRCARPLPAFTGQHGLINRVLCPDALRLGCAVLLCERQRGNFLLGQPGKRALVHRTLRFILRLIVRLAGLLRLGGRRRFSSRSGLCCR